MRYVVLLALFGCAPEVRCDPYDMPPCEGLGVEVCASVNGTWYQAEDEAWGCRGYDCSDAALDLIEWCEVQP